MKETLAKMSSTVREGISELGLYPRASCIIMESIELYRSLMPCGVQIFLHPSLTFVGTDKSIDYVVVIVSMVGLSY